MAIYNYKCECGARLEETRRFGDNKPPHCRECKGMMTQVIGSNPFILKGSDWFKPAHYDDKWKLKGRK